MSDTPRTDAQTGFYGGSEALYEAHGEKSVYADFARMLERELTAALAERDALRVDAEKRINAIWEMANDGWLCHGPEGMSEVQKLVYEIAKEHPEFAALAARKEGA